MAQETYSANLHSSEFPFLAKNFGETVILPRYDHTYAGILQHSAQGIKHSGIPQAYYMHNVLPTEYGFQSVRYRAVTTFTGGLAPHDITNAVPIYSNYLISAAYSKFYLLFGDPVIATAEPGQTLYYYFPSSVRAPQAYSELSSIAYYLEGPAEPAFVQQKNYWTRGTDLVELVLDDIGFHHTLRAVGFTLSGVIESQGYLIGWNANNVYWSSLTTPYDFTPSQVTGAGGGSVAGIIGGIIRCVSTLNGFLIFSKENVIFAAYTGNARYPFTFSEVKNSSGIPNYYAVTNSGDSGVVYSISMAGFQSITGAAAETIVPDLHLFFQNRQFEIYNTITDAFEYENITTDFTPNLYIRLYYLANRYVCISFGRTRSTSPAHTPYYSHVLVYDTVLTRWGRLKFEHTCMYTHTDNAGFVTIPSRDYIGLVAPSGIAYVIDMAPDVPEYSDCVLILGKYQRDRGRFMKLEEVNTQFIELSKSFSLSSYFTYDGKTKAGIQPGDLALVKEGSRKYAFDLNAYNHSLVLKGGFHLNHLGITHADGGDV